MLRQLQIQNPWIFPVFLLLLNVVTKCLFLTSQEIGLDEPFSIYHAQFNFSALIEHLKKYNNPPLYELLLHIWIKLFGISPLSVRTLPFVFAVLSPLALYYSTKRHFSLSAAITSSLLLSLSSFLVQYSHDCRVYSLFLLLTILSMNLFLLIVNDPIRNHLQPFLFIVVNAALIYAHYFGFIVLFIQAVYLLIYFRSKIMNFVLYYFIIAIIYIPHLLVVMTRLDDSVKNGTWLTSPNGFESLYNMLWSFSNFPFITVFCMLTLFAGLYLGIKNIGFLKLNSARMLIILWFLVPYLGMFIVSYWIPMYLNRYLIFSLPAYYLLIAFSISALRINEMMKKIIASALVLSFAATMDLNPERNQHLLEAINVIKNEKRNSTLLVVTPWDFLPTFAYHYKRDYFSMVRDNQEYFLVDSLLKKDHLFIVNSITDLNPSLVEDYKEIIYLGLGKERQLTETQIPHRFMVKSQQAIKNKYYITTLGRSD